MAFDRFLEGRAQRRWVHTSEPLSHRSSYLIIAVTSILGWAVFISVGIAMARLAGFSW